MQKQLIAISVAILGSCFFLQLAMSQEPSRIWNLPRPSFGFVDEEGRVVISPQFEKARSFNHGFAQCFGYSDLTGKPDWKTVIFIDKSGHRYSIENSGHEFPTSDTKITDEIQVQGTTIVRDNYFAVWSTRGQFKLVQRSYDWCVSDESGQILKIFPLDWMPHGLNPKSGNYWCKLKDQAFEFTGAVGKSEMPGFEPIACPRQFEQEYAYFDGFSEGLAAVRTKDGRWYYIDADGQRKIELPPVYTATKTWVYSIIARCALRASTLAPSTATLYIRDLDLSQPVTVARVVAMPAVSYS